MVRLRLTKWKMFVKGHRVNTWDLVNLKALLKIYAIVINFQKICEVGEYF